MTQVGNRLRLARVQAGMTLRQAEEETGLSKDTISRIERGLRAPQPLTAAKLAEAYGRSIEEFLEAPKAPAPLPEAEQGRRSSVLTEAVIAAVDKWIDIVSKPDANTQKNFGVTDAASALGNSLEDLAGASWESLPSREQHQIMGVMEKLVELFQRVTQRVEDGNSEEEFKQQREKIREWTQRISA